MASNKNQHFVPRCYLRPFTEQSANKAINVFNIDLLRFIALAPVKNQCSGDYFYGHDLVMEKTLQLLEADYAKALTRVLIRSQQPSGEDRSTLLRFWLLQHLRTEAASLRSVEMAASITEGLELPSEEFVLGIKKAVQIAMEAFFSSKTEMDDLKICLIRNRSNIPFVTSDDPAILTNRWYFSNRGRHHSSFGMQSSGALIMLPLSPEVLCLGYDGDVYSVPREGTWVDARSDRDIAAFNEHQFLNCRANIFLREKNHATIVEDAFIKVAARRLGTRHQLNYAVKDFSNNDVTRYRSVSRDEAIKHESGMVHTQGLNAEPSSWPSQIRPRKKGAVYTNGSGIGYVRLSWTKRQSVRPFVKESPWPS
jgi:hypothetical protein